MNQIVGNRHLLDGRVQGGESLVTTAVVDKPGERDRPLVPETGGPRHGGAWAARVAGRPSGVLGT